MRLTYIRESDGATMIEVAEHQFVSSGLPNKEDKGPVIAVSKRRPLGGPAGMSISPLEAEGRYLVNEFFFR